MTKKQDGEQILQHIHSIFQAFLRQDRDTLRKMHTPDWTGFQGPSVSIERGIDAYMVNAEKSLQNLRGTGYELLDTEIQIYDDVALVYYIARYDYLDRDGRQGSIPRICLASPAVRRSAFCESRLHATDSTDVPPAVLPAGNADVFGQG